MLRVSLLLSSKLRKRSCAREGETDRHRQRRQTDKLAGRQASRQAERDIKRHTGRQTESSPYFMSTVKTLFIMLDSDILVRLEKG